MPLHELLAVGNLHSDGFSVQAAVLVLGRPELMPDLVDVLLHGLDAARGHAADAIERVSRSRLELVSAWLSQLLAPAFEDPAAMVRWHLGMLLTNLAFAGEAVERVVPVLLRQLGDENAFVRSWAVSGLCILARRFESYRDDVLEGLAPLRRDERIAVRHRAELAIRILVGGKTAIPRTWIKGTANYTV